jgi:hypothetical protein
MQKPKQHAGPPMTLGNMRQLCVERLLASCLNDACRHQGLVDVSNYPADTEVPWFRSRVKRAKCGGRGNKIDVRPNWKEQQRQPHRQQLVMSHEHDA